MNISSVNVVITQEDLLGIIREVVSENVPVKGLKINQVNLNNNIEVYGEYSSKINAKFMVVVELCAVKNNVLNLKIKKVKVFNLKVFNFVISSILSKFVKGYDKYGVFFEKGILQIDFDLICNHVPQVNFNILSAVVKDDVLKVELSDVNISLKNDSKKKFKINNEQKKQDNIVKKNDVYSSVRENIVKKFPNKYEKLAEYILVVPDIIALLVRILKDKRVSKRIKILIIAILSYLCFPIDVLPDFLPVIGQVDDVAVAFLGIDYVMKAIPKNIVLENWQGEDDIFDIVSKGVIFVSKFLNKNKRIKLKRALRLGRKKKQKILKTSKKD